MAYVIQVSNTRRHVIACYWSRSPSAGVPWQPPHDVMHVMQEFESELKNSADDAADAGKKLADDVKSKVDDTLK